MKLDKQTIKATITKIRKLQTYPGVCLYSVHVAFPTVGGRNGLSEVKGPLFCCTGSHQLPFIDGYKSIKDAKPGDVFYLSLDLMVEA